MTVGVLEVEPVQIGDWRIPTLPRPLLSSLADLPVAALHLPAVGLSASTRRSIAITLRRLAELLDPRGMTMAEAKQRLTELGSLPENWDGEGAPPPTADAMERAGRILTWADANALEIADVDVDVLGGIAIWLKGAAREAWIACMNNGNDTVVAGYGAQAMALRWESEMMDRVRDLLAESNGSRPGE